MKKSNYKYLTVLIFYFSFFVGEAQNFYTEGNGIRNVVSAKVKGKSVFYISEIDGAIACYSLKGKKLWSNKTETPALLFEIVASDIDNDGNDDVLGASGDGNIYCWKSTGELLWKFYPGVKVRLSELAVVGKGSEKQIFAGGNNFKLYEINSQGKYVGESNIKGTVRKLESGNFIDSNKEVLFLFTLKHDKYSSEFFGYIDPKTKKVLKSGNISKILKGYKSLMVQDLSVTDVNKDGKDELLLFGSGQGPTFSAIDGNLKKVAGYIGSLKQSQRYAYTFGTCLLPHKDQIVFQMGGFLHVTDLQGKLIAKTGERYRGIIFNGFVFQPEEGKLFGTGQIGGGNAMYEFDVSKKQWWKTKHKLIGRSMEVEDNLNQLYKQSLKFKMPNYQKKSDKEFVMITGIKETSEVKRLKGQDLKFVKQYIYSESTDRAHLVAKIGESALKKDKRKKYNLSRKDIVKLAKEHEANNTPFALWAGHGSDPFITQIATIEEIVKVAPKTCYGFVYAEMANTSDPRVIHFVREYVPRMAKAIRKHKSNAKLYFRYKNMFWAADCHSELWKELFFSNKYNDVLIPSAEDTNNRLQDLNFAGRVGMFASGYVDNYAMRLVDDNPTSWRPLSPGGQRSVSPYLRNGAIMAAYGSRYGLLFNIGYLEEPGMNILFALMKSGVIPVVEREDILSIGSWHLVKDLDEEHVEHRTNGGHDLMKYQKDDEDGVVSVSGVHWCGTSIPDHDYSKIAMGCNYRWLNFLPEMPNGMVPVSDIGFESKLKQTNTDYFVTNMNHGFVDGAKKTGKAFGSHMKKVVENGSKQLLVTVKGASWSLIKIDDKHVRLVLVDSGYIDPQERDVVVQLNREFPISATDILSNSKININGQKIKVQVPAGSLRVIDLEYKNKIK